MRFRRTKKVSQILPIEQRLEIRREELANELEEMNKENNEYERKTIRMWRLLTIFEVCILVIFTIIVCFTIIPIIYKILLSLLLLSIALYYFKQGRKEVKKVQENPKPYNKIIAKNTKDIEQIDEYLIKLKLNKMTKEELSEIIEKQSKMPNESYYF